MKWHGETEEQQDARISRWHEVFAVLPAQMECGAWVWMERYETRRRGTNVNNRTYWQSRLIADRSSAPANACRDCRHVGSAYDGDLETCYLANGAAAGTVRQGRAACPDFGAVPNRPTATRPAPTKPPKIKAS